MYIWMMWRRPNSNTDKNEEMLHMYMQGPLEQVCLHDGDRHLYTLHVKIQGKTKGSNQGNQPIAKKTVSLSGSHIHVQQMYSMYMYS